MQLCHHHYHCLCRHHNHNFFTTVPVAVKVRIMPDAFGIHNFGKFHFTADGYAAVVNLRKNLMLLSGSESFRQREKCSPKCGASFYAMHWLVCDSERAWPVFLLRYYSLLEKPSYLFKKSEVYTVCFILMHVFLSLSHCIAYEK